MQTLAQRQRRYSGPGREHMTVTMDPQLKDSLKGIARTSGTPLSHLVEDLLRTAVDDLAASGNP